jgi:uncharacterized protein (TIGR02598 family)
VGRLLRPPGDSGFTLTEIALALAIFSFALVSMLGVLSVGLRNSRKANLQVSATNLLSSIVADIQSARKVSLSPTEVQYQCTKVPLQCVVRSTSPSAFEVNLSYTDPLILDEGGTVNNTTVSNGLLKVLRVRFFAAASSVPAVRIRVSWPANAPDNATPEGFLETIAALPPL